MKTKSFMTIIAGILGVLLLASLASAATQFTVSTNTLTFEDNNDQTLTVTNTNSTDTITITFLSTVDVNGYTFDISGNSTIDANSTTILTLSPQSAIDFDSINLGDIYSGTFDISDGSETETITVEVQNTEFCLCDNPGDLDVSIDVSNIEGFGEEDDEWYPGDTIELEIEVENRGNEDINDVEIEWGLYNPSTGEWIIEEEESDFDLDEDEDETITVEFSIDPDEYDVDYDYYVLYVKATGETDDSEECTCDSTSQDISLILEDDFVIVRDIEFSPETGSCGSVVRVTGEVWNIGEDDQDEVSVRVYNPDLFDSKTIDVGDIDYLEGEDFSFEFEIPEGLDEKTYNIEFEVYDEDNDIYENDEESRVIFYYKIENCGLPTPDATVSANLIEGGRAGRELVVEATITNTGDEIGSYNIVISGYESWASSAQASKTATVIGSGQSDTLTITFDTNSDAAGEQTFAVELVAADGETVATQPVSITLEEGGFNFLLTGNVISEDNWYLWGIGALNIILVIIIIIVAIRIARA